MPSLVILHRGLGTLVTIGGARVVCRGGDTCTQGALQSTLVCACSLLSTEGMSHLEGAGIGKY